MKRKTLYIGLDESNHGNYPEICVATFSTLRVDCRPKKFQLDRVYTRLRCLEHPQRNYRFLILSNEQIKETKSKTSLIAPSLINPYLNGKDFEEIKILLDGYFSRNDIKILKYGLETDARILCRGFINRKNKIKKNRRAYYIQPFIVGLADLKANELYSLRPLEELNKCRKKLELLL